MASKLNIKVEGAPAVVAALEGIRAGVANRVLREAIRKRASEVNKAAKRLVRSKRSGALKKSIGIVVKKATRTRVGVVAVVGPRKGFREAVGPDGRPNDPVKYAHLVEGGRKAIVAGPGKVLANRHVKGAVFGRHVWGVSPRPFMAPAAAEAAAGWETRMAADVAAGLAREVRKSAAKGKSVLD